MKNTSYRTLLYLLTILFFNSCIPNLTLDEVDCSECYSDRPIEAELIVKISPNNSNGIAVVVFKGRLESRDTVLLDTLYNSTEYIMVPIDQYYTVQAKYITDSGVVYAIDGDELKSVKITGQCNGTCWIIKGGILNNTLKYNHPLP